VQTRVPLRRPLSLFFKLITGLALLSCGGDSATTPETTGPTTLSIGLSKSSALPSERVLITGILPAQELSGVYARVQDPAGGGETVSYVGRNEEGNPFVVVPLFPDAANMAEGGTVALTLLGDELSSNTVTLTIQALPAASVTIQEEVTHLQDLLSSWLALYGTSRTALRAMDPATMPIQLFPLWVAQELLDDPANPNSLRAMVDGPVPLLDNQTIDFELANRLLSLVDGESFFNEEIASVDSFVSANGALSFLTTTNSMRKAAASVAAEGCIEGGDYGINDAASLDDAMWAARFAINRLDGASGEYLDDLGNFVSAMGVIPELKPLAGAVGGALFVYKAINQAAGAVLPSSFNNSATDFEIQDKTQFFEDDEGGHWAKFKVTAVSQGWKMDQFILDSIATFAGFEDFGGFSTITEGMGKLAANLTDFAINTAVSQAIGAATNGSDIVEICAGVWPDIDISEPTYAKASIPLGTSIKFVDSTNFKTVEPGNSEIRLETKPGTFGGASPAIKQKPVKVLRIDVTVLPDAAQMDPQEQKSFTASVTNANDDQVDWIVPAGLQEISRSVAGNTITIETPENPWSPPFSLIARSQANTGAREGKVDSDPREGGTVISVKGKKVTVTPHSKCIGNDEPLQFSAAVTGVENPVIKWSVDGYGHIGEDTGLYTSPPIGSTDDLIIAEVVGQDPPLMGYAYVQVGACVCYFDIAVGGNSTWSAGGSDVAYLVSEFSPTEGAIQWYFIIPEGINGESPAGFTASVGSTEDKIIPQPGDTGDWKMNMGYTSSQGESWGVSQVDSMVTATLHVDEMTDTFMRGSMTGTAVQRGDPEDPDLITSRVFITVNFRAGKWDGGAWPCTEDAAKLPTVLPKMKPAQSSWK